MKLDGRWNGMMIYVRQISFDNRVWHVEDIISESEELHGKLAQWHTNVIEPFGTGARITDTSNWSVNLGHHLQCQLI